MVPPNLPLLLLLLFASTIIAQKLPKEFCATTGNFTANSTYQTTLTTLLSSISTTNSLSLTYGFFNASSAVSGTSQTLYVIGSCRGDLTAENCRTCLDASASDIRRLCPLQKEAVLYSENCTVRYSNASIFGTVVIEPYYPLYNEHYVSNPDRYNTALRTLLDSLRGEAAGGGSLRKYATRNVPVGFNTIYAMLQCTPDLTEQPCNDCLVKIVGMLTDCCAGRIGVKFLAPSCQFRYETDYRFFEHIGQPIPPPPPPPPPPIGSNKSTVIRITAIAVPVGVLMVFLSVACCFVRRKATRTHHLVQEEAGMNEITNEEPLQYDLAIIQAATNNFSHQNKLGEGGFGEVFQGRLLNGQDIAVKRLSKSSRQGAEEFKNEVTLVAKLQHRNLVRLLGYCLEGEEKLLVYEFVPNKSLDYFLYDPEKSMQLDWLKRCKIAQGIARGMLYLHEDSRLCIIHRDLKASNILLDSGMNPKISDFGTARIFGVDQTHASTNKIVGTLGYMPPEYARNGKFSVKSDVYSFGVLLLEIIIGKKNDYFCRSEGGEDLASYAWRHWRDGTQLEVLDPAILDFDSRDEVLRCLHVSLLCVQEEPVHRPTMATVLSMLSSQPDAIPQPQHPAFFPRSRDQSISRSIQQSVNGLTITEAYPR